MAHQEEGWPLGLRPLNERVGLVRNSDLSASGSISFSTLLTASPSCSSLSSSDLDTESTGSFFHEKSITLGSLIGVSSILELSRRSTRGSSRAAAAETVRGGNKMNNVYKPKPWLFSLCSKLSTDAVNTSNANNNAPSLGHFLQAERRSAAIYMRSRNILQTPTSIIDINAPCDFSSSISAANSLFVGGQVAPDQSSTFPILDQKGRTSGGPKQSKNEFLEAGNGYHGIPLLFSCLRGFLIK